MLATLLAEAPTVDSMYARYIRERTWDEIIETTWGFATYRWMADGKGVYIIDIYVLPGRRTQGEAAAIADQIVKIAKERGCTELFGTVDTSAKGSSDSVKVLLAYGMTPHSANNNVIVFRKEIK